jgi:NitT/TauT family transport system permease protein
MQEPERGALDRWLPWGGLVFLLLAWEAAVRLLNVSETIVPAPSAIVRSFYYGLSSGIYLEHLAVTSAAAFLGLVIAILVGTAAGSLIAQSPIAERTIYPYIIVFQAMPKIALAPLLIIWFGYGTGSKVALGTVIACFPILVNQLVGLKNCDQGKIDIMRALSASEWQIFRLVKFPNALPFLFAGIRIATAFVVLGVVISEFLGAQKGLGTLIIIANGNLDGAQTFAILVMLGLLGLALYAAVGLLERRLLRWVPADAAYA